MGRGGERKVERGRWGILYRFQLNDWPTRCRPVYYGVSELGGPCGATYYWVSPVSVLSRQVDFGTFWDRYNRHSTVMVSTESQNPASGQVMCNRAVSSALNDSIALVLYRYLLYMYEVLS